jgi:chromosome segregation protein
MPTVALSPEEVSQKHGELLSEANAIEERLDELRTTIEQTEAKARELAVEVELDEADAADLDALKNEIADAEAERSILQDRLIAKRTAVERLKSELESMAEERRMQRRREKEQEYRAAVEELADRAKALQEQNEKVAQMETSFRASPEGRPHDPVAWERILTAARGTHGGISGARMEAWLKRLREKHGYDV